MKTNNDEDESVFLSNGPVSSLALIWFLICVGFIVWVAFNIFVTE